MSPAHARRQLGWLTALGLLLAAASPALAAGQPRPAAARTAATAALNEDAGEATWQAALAAYDGGDYGQASQHFQALLQAGYDSGWIYYNLGNSLLRQGALGSAVAAYRQSASRLPRQADVQANLAYARQRSIDGALPPEVASGWRRLFFWHFGLNQQELLGLTASLNLAFWGLLAWRRRKRDAHEGALLGSWALGLALLAVASAAAWHAWLPLQVAVVVPPEIEVYSGTDRGTVVRFRLHAGTEIWVRDAHADWLRVQLADGKEGWVATTDVEQVSL